MTTVASIQMNSYDQVGLNIQEALPLIAEAASSGATLVVLPEMFTLMGGTAAQKQMFAEPFKSGEVQKQLAACARQQGIWLAAGTMPIKEVHEQKPTASCLLFNPQGECVSRYDKIHLFDVDLPNGEVYRESDTYRHGDLPTIIDTALGRIAFAICYDLRFPELFLHFRQQQVDMIVLPAAFTAHTGAAHWHTLLRARALDAGAYIIAANQVGQHANGAKTYGHSLIVDPWGTIVAEATDDCKAVITSTLDRAFAQRTRRALGTHTNARL